MKLIQKIKESVQFKLTFFSNEHYNKFFIEYDDLKLFANLVLEHDSIPLEVKKELMNQVGNKNFSFLFDSYLWIGKRNATI